MHYAEAAMCLRTGETHEILPERNRLLAQALENALNGYYLAKAEFPILCDVGERNIKNLSQRIQYKPEALMHLDFSTTATSGGPSSTSDSDTNESNKCPRSRKQVPKK